LQSLLVAICASAFSPILHLIHLSILFLHSAHIR
jgi:hypothetical protein